jgi:hypothetical protein
MIDKIISNMIEITTINTLMGYNFFFLPMKFWNHYFKEERKGQNKKHSVRRIKFPTIFLIKERINRYTMFHLVWYEMVNALYEVVSSLSKHSSHHGRTNE